MTVDRQFVATCYAALLGREPESDAVCVALAEGSLEAVVGHFAGSAEFRSIVIDALMGARLPDQDRFVAELTRYVRYWAADRLPLADATRAAIVAAQDWWDFLRLLLEDSTFMAFAGRGPLAVPPLPSWVTEERFERLQRQRRS